VGSPLWKFPGTVAGRILPQYSTPAGTYQEGYYYYSHRYVYDAYQAYGETPAFGHVFCLGADEDPFQPHRFNVDDAVTVEQEFNTADYKLVRFNWHIRIPGDLPQARTIVSSAGQVRFVRTSGLVVTTPSPDGCQGLVISTPASPFSASDKGALLSISGSTDPNNDGAFPLDGIPSNQGSVLVGDRALYYNVNMAQTTVPDPAAVTVKILGLQWTTRAFLDSGSGYVEQLKIVEQPKHTWYRGFLALNISKVTPGALVKVKFELKLEAAA